MFLNGERKLAARTKRAANYDRQSIGKHNRFFARVALVRQCPAQRFGSIGRIDNIHAFAIVGEYRNRLARGSAFDVLLRRPGKHPENAAKRNDRA